MLNINNEITKNVILKTPLLNISTDQILSYFSQIFGNIF